VARSILTTYHSFGGLHRAAGQRALGSCRRIPLRQHALYVRPDGCSTTIGRCAAPCFRRQIMRRGMQSPPSRGRHPRSSTLSGASRPRRPTSLCTHGQRGGSAPPPARAICSGHPPLSCLRDARIVVPHSLIAAPHLNHRKSLPSSCCTETVVLRHTHRSRM